MGELVPDKPTGVEDPISHLTSLVVQMDASNQTAHTLLRDQHVSIRSEVSHLASTLEGHIEQEERVERALFGDGNGMPGHGERLRVLEAFVDSQRKVFWILVPAILLGVGALVWTTIAESIARGGAG